MEYLPLTVNEALEIINIETVREIGVSKRSPEAIAMLYDNIELLKRIGMLI